MELKALIFDLDGTLLDSGGLWTDIDRRFLGARGFAVPDDYQSAVALMSPLQAAEYTIKRFGLNKKPEELAQEFHDMAVDAYRNEIGLFEGAGEYVKAVKKAGMKTALATASPPEFYRPALERCGIMELFDLCVCSSGSLYKGVPEFYRYVAEKLGVDCAQCEVYDDVYKNIAAAKDAGMKTCFIRNETFNTGLGDTAKADRIISSFTELIRY